jgi:hypothetical protein
LSPCETHHSSSLPYDGYRFAPTILRAISISKDCVIASLKANDAMAVTYPRLWLKHWRARQALTNYPLYDVPHKAAERTLPEEQARENFDYFMRVKLDRLVFFQSWLRNNFRVNASLDAGGAQSVDRWVDDYGGGLIGDEWGRSSIFDSYQPTWIRRYAGCNVMVDLGIFMGEFMILKRPKLYWEMYQGHQIEPATF